MPSDQPFREVARMLRQAGYELVRVSGSHHVFEKTGAPLVSIPVHRGKVKPFYVRKVENICRDTASD